jgi:hypothetical protein
VRTGRSTADVVLAADHGYRDEDACRTAAADIPDLLNDAEIVQPSDATWRWVCRADSGRVAIKSAQFTDPVRCESDLASVRLSIGGATPRAYPPPRF